MLQNLGQKGAFRRLLLLSASKPRYFCTSRLQRSCWKCGAAVASPSTMFCAKCEIIQPPDSLVDVDHFALLSVDRNYKVPLDVMEKNYWKLQMKLHPDRYTTKSPEEQEYSATLSALVNHAYSVLKSPLLRANYMLGVKEEVPEGQSNAVSGELLMEVMAVREEIQDTEDKDELEALKQTYTGKLELLQSDLAKDLEGNKFEEGKEIVVRMRYYDKILAELESKLTN